MSEKLRSDSSAPDRETPFATATVARIYLDQGKLEQAEAIFRQLLEKSPHDEHLAEGLAEVRRRRVAQSVEPVDTVGVEVSGRMLRCRWNVSPAGERRATLVAGGSGKLALRVAGFPSDELSVPDDTRLTEHSGSMTLPAPSAALLAAVAVGILTAEGQFVSIAHSRIMLLTREETTAKQ